MSFIYKPQKSYDIDVNMIHSFITHYQFAESIFRETIRGIIPLGCSLEIEALEEEPFFSYMDYFIRQNHYKQETESFYQRYKECMKRDFELDCIYHNKLKEKAVGEIDTYTISDVEINKAGGGNINDLRQYVLEYTIPFEISPYSETIDKIFIDEKILAEKIKHYNAKNDYRSINALNILNLIKHRVEERERAEEYRMQRIAEFTGKVGDYILLKDKSIANENQNTGIIKEITLCYDELTIKYAILKKDFTESNLPLKEIKGSDISYILTKELFDNEIENIHIKPQLIKLFKDKGVKNKIVKPKKKKISYSFKSIIIKKSLTDFSVRLFRTRSRDRTGMGITPLVFETSASTNSAIRALAFAKISYFLENTNYSV